VPRATIYQIAIGLNGRLPSHLTDPYSSLFPRWAPTPGSAGKVRAVSKGAVGASTASRLSYCSRCSCTYFKKAAHVSSCCKVARFPTTTSARLPT
jgi:hypothetical protein